MLWEYVKRCMLQNPFQTISDGRQSFTFAEALEKSEKLAKRLSGDLYGIYCKSDVMTIIAILACLCAKKTALPLSNRYGEKHNASIIGTMKVNSFIEDENGYFVVKTGSHLMCKENLENVAWILCTSGSTGKPKGVMLTYDAIYHNLCGSNSFFVTSSTDRLLAGRGFYHCSSLTGELLMSLIRGVGIYCYSGGFSPASIMKIMMDEGITVYSGTPTVFYYLCQFLDRKEKIRSQLGYCNVGGEMMSKQSFDIMKKALKETTVIHSYGLTETCSRATYVHLSEMREANFAGSMLPGMEVVVMDERRNECKPYQRGEILLKGKSLMKGYYQELKQTFRVMNDGWFRTGDMGYLDEEGKLYVAGRKDNMIIRAGMNIYPYEIEQILRGEPDIEDIKVVVDKTGNVTQELAVQVLPVKGRNLSKADVLDLCKRRLPEYLIPNRIEMVDGFVLSQAGKR